MTQKAIILQKWCNKKNHHINSRYIPTWRDVLATGHVTSTCTTLIIIGCLHMRLISLNKLRNFWVEILKRPCNSYWLPTQTFTSNLFNVLLYSIWHILTFSTPKNWTKHWSKKLRGRRMKSNQKQQQIHREEQLRQWNLENTNLFCFYALLANLHLQSYQIYITPTLSIARMAWHRANLQACKESLRWRRNQEKNSDQEKVGFWPMDELHHPWHNICSLIHTKCNPKSYDSGIKYHMTLNIIFTVLPCYYN